MRKTGATESEAFPRNNKLNDVHQEDCIEMVFHVSANYDHTFGSAHEAHEREKLPLSQVALGSSQLNSAASCNWDNHLPSFTTCIVNFFSSSPPFPPASAAFNYICRISDDTATITFHSGFNEKKAFRFTHCASFCPLPENFCF
jgi:hypothetical protein